MFPKGNTERPANLKQQRRPSFAYSWFLRGEKLTRGGLLLVIGALVGPLMTNLPVAASVWGITGLLALYLFSHLWREMGRWMVWWGLGTAALTAFCTFMAVREYTGANYKLQYRVCGMGLLVGPDSPAVSKVVFGIEVLNPNERDLYAAVDRHLLSLADRKSVQSFSEKPFLIAANANWAGAGKIDDWIILNPQIPLAPQIDGEVHYEINFGPTQELMRQNLVIDGKFVLTYLGDGSYQRFLFVPSADNSPGFVSSECSIREHEYGLTSEQ